MSSVRAPVFCVPSGLAGLLRVVALFVCGSAPLARAGLEERLLHAELELTGPLTSVRTQMQSECSTRIVGRLRDGERRRVRVPLVIDAPLWRELLAELPLPPLEAEGTGRARWEGWSVEQPRARLEGLPAALRSAGAPPAALLTRRLAPISLLWLLVCGAATSFVWRFRRRNASKQGSAVETSAPLRATRAIRMTALLTTGIAGAAVGLLLPGIAETRGSASSGATSVLEADREAASAVRVATARGRLAGAAARAPDGLESVPAAAPVEISLGPDGDVLAIQAAEGVLLTARRVVPAAELGRITREKNELRAFEAVWLRSGSGSWRFHGPWAQGEPLPPGQGGQDGSGGAEEGGGRPVSKAPGEGLEHGRTLPGWLAAGLPPGRGVLVGRFEDGSWLRLRGF